MKLDIISEECILAYDNHLWDIIKEIDISKYLNPINSEEEKKKFLKEYESGNCYNPQFKYEVFDENLELLYNELLLIRDQFHECKNSLFAPYYIKIIDDLVLRINLFKDRNQPNFGGNVTNLYGSPSNLLVKQAESNLLKYQNIKEKQLESLTPEAVLKIFKTEMEKFGLNWDFEILTRASAKLSVNASQNTIKINASEKFSENNMKRYIFHEIRTHVFRAENGKLQRFLIFRNGFPNYINTEEGLALYVEDKNGLITPADIKRYSARVIAANDSINSSFFDVFSKLVNYFSPSEAYSIVQRVKRSFMDTSMAGGYTKDFVYMDGFQKVSSFLNAGNSIEDLFVGKIGLNDVDIIQELINQGVVVKPKYLPFNKT
ncbi:tyrosine/phenylalanine carboxypeptidase domain-containing protein [Methanolobus vulcani]|uniref:DUF1704 domain-containing protein n=1 Tax=Methanolobus vulcani TaxID=38026 RepID=A0A7Z8P1M6_9EURY|nr:tyrosine/phenylalanine carboxypeptidase domain-containing protein [Methanolobus vulcani]TQD24017.1 DUF1704 domain-containing protein [Methanolobus vulcani]